MLSLHRLLVVYDRLTPAGAAVALVGYFAHKSAEGAPGVAIKPQWTLQPGSVLTGTDHNNPVAINYRGTYCKIALGLSLRG